MARDFNDSLATRAADRSVCGMVDRRWAHGPLSASSLDQIRPSACPMRLAPKSDVAAEVRWSPLASKHFELAASQIALAPSGHPLQQGSSVLCSVPRYSSTANHRFITIKLRVPLGIFLPALLDRLLRRCLYQPISRCLGFHTPRHINTAPSQRVVIARDSYRIIHRVERPESPKTAASSFAHCT